MKNLDDSLITPVYVKSRPDVPWPEQNVFYLLSADGLFLCRNHQWFRSCVPAPRWPTELARQEPILQLRYPKVPRRLMELVVGFFTRVGQLHGAEAAVLVAWDSSKKRVRLIIPEQLATVSQNHWGEAFPIGIKYKTPTDLSSDLSIIGDIHSHVDSPAYASHIDKEDETHRPGLHIVIGKIGWEPPEFHVEAVVDGTRFDVAPDMVLGGYRQRRLRVPPSWMKQLKVKTYGSKGHNVHYDSNQPAAGGHYGDHWIGTDCGYGNFNLPPAHPGSDGPYSSWSNTSEDNPQGPTDPETQSGEIAEERQHDDS